MRQAADRRERSVADGPLESQVTSDAFAAWLQCRSCKEYNCRQQPPDAVAHGDSDMAKTAKATKNAADRVEQALAGEADVAPVGAAGKEKEDPLLVTALRETEPERLPDGSVDLAGLLEQLDDGDKHGGCVAYHIGVELVRLRQEAVDKAGGRRKGTLEAWYADTVKRLDRKESSIRLYMKIAMFIDENVAKSSTPLKLSILARPLRAVTSAMDNVIHGREPEAKEKRKVDEVKDWVRRATNVQARAELGTIPLVEIHRHADAIAGLIQRAESGIMTHSLEEAIIPADWAVPDGQSLIKYPGGKTAHSGHIVGFLRYLAELQAVHTDEVTFVDVFVGGGSIVNTVARSCPKLFTSFKINDLHPATAATYNVVFSQLDELKERLQQVELTQSEWERLAAIYNDVKGSYDELDLAVATIVPFETGRQNYGPMRHTPPSVFRQMWDVERCCARLEAYRDDLQKAWSNSAIRRNMECGTWDAIDLIRKARAGWVLYLDPPYVAAGTELYSLDFTLRDHERLRDALTDSRATWLLSYDDHPLIRELYKDQFVRAFPPPGGSGKTELLIWPKWLGTMPRPSPAPDWFPLVSLDELPSRR